VKGENGVPVPATASTAVENLTANENFSNLSGLRRYHVGSEVPYQDNHAILAGLMIRTSTVSMKGAIKVWSVYVGEPRHCVLIDVRRERELAQYGLTGLVTVPIFRSIEDRGWGDWPV
jgi:hypothetical protein